MDVDSTRAMLPPDHKHNTMADARWMMDGMTMCSLIAPLDAIPFDRNKGHQTLFMTNTTAVSTTNPNPRLISGVAVAVFTY